MYRLDSPELTEALRAYDDTDDELSELWRALDDDQSRLDKLEDDYYVNGVLTDERRFTRLHTQLEAKLADTRKTLDRAQQRHGRGQLPSGDEARAAWDDRGLEWRHQLIKKVVTTIIVGPGRRGYNQFDPDRLKKPYGIPVARVTER